MAVGVESEGPVGVIDADMYQRSLRIPDPRDVRAVFWSGSARGRWRWIRDRLPRSDNTFVVQLSAASRNCPLAANDSGTGTATLGGRSGASRCAERCRICTSSSGTRAPSSRELLRLYGHVGKPSVRSPAVANDARRRQRPRWYSLRAEQARTSKPPEGQPAAAALDATLGLPYGSNQQVAIFHFNLRRPSDNQHRLPHHRPCQRAG